MTNLSFKVQRPGTPENMGGRCARCGSCRAVAEPAPFVALATGWCHRRGMVTAKGAQGSFSVAVVCAAAAHRLVREAPTCRVVNATTQAAAA